MYVYKADKFLYNKKGFAYSEDKYFNIFKGKAMGNSIRACIVSSF